MRWTSHLIWCGVHPACHMKPTTMTVHVPAPPVMLLCWADWSAFPPPPVSSTWPWATAHCTQISSEHMDNRVIFILNGPIQLLNIIVIIAGSQNLWLVEAGMCDSLPCCSANLLVCCEAFWRNEHLLECTQLNVELGLMINSSKLWQSHELWLKTQTPLSHQPSINYWVKVA